MCGLFGIYGHRDAARLCYLGLYALQHRGEGGAGIASYGNGQVKIHKGVGLASEVFDEGKIRTLKGHLAIGHVHYSTTGESTLRNVEPFLVDYLKGPIAVAHNGSLTNGHKLRHELEKEGSLLQTITDSEIIVHLLAKANKRSLKEDIIWTLSQLEGAYSLLLTIGDLLVGIRDPKGFKPLALGKFRNAYVLASEACALDLIQATYLREIEPGEVIFINKDGIENFKPLSPSKYSHCIFEYIYFARPDSNIFGQNVYLARKNLGRRLAIEHPVEADLVMPLPDSGNYAALGFAEQSRLPYELGVVRNHYVGRTFIQPAQPIRDFKVKLKLNPIREVLRNKRIVIVEDSIVRGTTSRSRVKTLRKAGAKEIHMRVSCPPIRFPCFYGVDFPTKEELIASKFSIDQIREFMNLDSLGYLSQEGMLEAMPLPKEDFCTACFDGLYPVEPVGTAGVFIRNKKNIPGG
ncbi:TPA: amidophosphoribosyltransferase [bacterium]|nr:amidophosphoribosyltransferase [bacterium]